MKLLSEQWQRIGARRKKLAPAMLEDLIPGASAAEIADLAARSYCIVDGQTTIEYDG